jgi:AI-2 transport protein TqsA
MTSKFNIPFYLKVSQILLGLISFLFVMYIGQAIILPFLFAVIIGILLDPIVNFLCRHKINHAFSIIITILLAVLILFCLGYFLSSQIAAFSNEFPKFEQKFTELFNDLITWISGTFGLNKNKILLWLNKTEKNGLASSKELIAPLVITITGLLMMLVLLPVYTFLILFYRSLFKEFIIKLFPKEKHKFVMDLINQSKTLIQSYLVGLMIETGIVAVLNSVGLLALGVESAVLVGVIGAILNLIPYIGGLIAIALAMIMGITSQPPIYALWIFILYNLIQFADNHFLIPKIVASKVNVNALISIIVVLIGGALWGIPGMFLSIPLTAIVKIIFDRIEPLKPLGFLLGNYIPPYDRKQEP